VSNGERPTDWSGHALLALGLPARDVRLLAHWCARRDLFLLEVSEPTRCRAAISRPPPSVEIAVVDCLALPDSLPLLAQAAFRFFCITRRRATVTPAAALRSGALDCLTRPYGADELLARLDVRVGVGVAARAVQARHAGTLRLNPEGCSVSCDASEVVLRRAEFALLAEIATAGGGLRTAKYLVNHCLGTAGDGSSAKTHISRVRKKFRGAGLGDPIATVRGRGYRLGDGMVVDAAVQEKTA
jgi:DNA-binding winged helix-turn-helix (wHTH) protein